MIDLNCSLCERKFEEKDLNEAYAGETLDDGQRIIWYRCPDCGRLTGLED